MNIGSYYLIYVDPIDGETRIYHGICFSSLASARVFAREELPIAVEIVRVARGFKHYKI